MTLKHCIATFLLFFLSHGTLPAQVFLTGAVTDVQSGDPIAAATVRILGTSKGTITNAQGRYSLALDSSGHTIVFSYLAYQPETLRIAGVEPGTTLVRNIALIPSPISIPEVLVLAEDPALEIIRKAIAGKRKWMDKLNSYRFEAFTRQVLRRDTAIAGIAESYTSGFVRTGDTLREIVRQRRQTKNVPMNENFAAVRRIVNFNDDEVRLFSIRVEGNASTSTFTGPTAPDALDNYDYKLLKTSRMSGVDVYEIRMTPRSRLKPLFDGTITIADGTFAVMGVDVRPNEALTIPFIRDVDLRYRQQFALYDSSFWMPTDIRVTGGFTVRIAGFSLPRVGIDALSSIYEYSINVPLPDSIFTKPRLVVDSSSSLYDSTYWKNNEVLPLTGDEQHAYRTLDSAETLEKQFQPKGPLTMLGDGGSIFSFLDVRFDRVEGLYAGGKFMLDSLLPQATIAGSAGYGFSDRRAGYRLEGMAFTSKDRSLGAGGELYEQVDHVPDEDFYGPTAISLAALLDKNDYRDYYLARGFRASIQARPSRQLGATLSFTSEQELSLDLQTQYSLISPAKMFRPNPTIENGVLRSVRLDMRLGQEEAPLDIVSRNALEISLEHSSPRIAGSEFDFTRSHGVFTWSIKTFSRGMLFPPSLRVRLSGGSGSGALPPQRLFAIDSRASGYAPFGVLKGSGIKEFSGNRFAMINLEHNFRSVPFLALNLPFLYRNGIEMIVDASFAQTWNGTSSTSGGWYSEAGIGVSRILDILRADLTYRIEEPRSLFFTVSIATLF